MKTNHTAIKTKWSIDQSQSEISFKVRHLVADQFEGTFKKFDAIIYTDAQDFRTADIDLWIDASSIETGDEKRDHLLKNHHFLDVNTHKQITFISTMIGLANAYGNRELWGKLTFLGITQKVKLIVQFGGMSKDPWGNERAVFSIFSTIKGSDWGLTWRKNSESESLKVYDEIEISCEIDLRKEGQKCLTKLFEPSFEKAGILQTSQNVKYLNV
jgi:polyisoprenoid-binding protein YceI